MKQVIMKHPNLDSEIEVPESAVPIHMASGWAVVEDTGAPAKQTATSKPKASAPAQDKE